MKFGYYAGFGLSYFEHVFEIKFIQHINRTRTVKYLENVQFIVYRNFFVGLSLETNYGDEFKLALDYA